MRTCCHQDESEGRSGSTPYTFTARPKKITTKPNSQSRLLALPPEIRNKIYELIFKFEDPIAFFGATERSRLRKRKVEVDKHPADLKSYIGLLRTCRQIYSEAGGVLYGSNDFRLAHAHSVLHDRNLNYVLHATARWLTSIEPRVAMLRTVVITVNETTKSDGRPLIRSDYNFFHDCFDILPLVKLYWSDNSGNLQVKVTDSVDFLKLLGDRNQEQLYRPVNTNILHSVLHQLGRGNIWDLKKCKSSLRSILVRRDGYYGHVCYRSTGPRIGFLRKFNILDGGKELRLFHPQKPSGLIRLPKFLQYRILREVVGSEYIEYDTDNSRWLKYQTGLLNMCKSLRKDWEKTVALKCNFVLSTYTHSQSNHFHKAGPFGNAGWLHALRKDRQLRQKNAVFTFRFPFESPRSSSFNPPTIMLNLSPATATSLSAVTISATRLHQLKGFPGSTPISIRLSPTTDEPTPAEASITTLREIVRRSFLLLCDIYFAHPPRTYYLHNIDIHISGHGKPLYAVLHADAAGDSQNVTTIPNRRPRTHSPDIARLVSGRIARLKNDWVTARFAQSGKEWERDFVTALGCFRNMCIKYDEEEGRGSSDRGRETNTELQVDGVVDISDFDRIDSEHVFSTSEDTEGVDFRAAEFRALNWREVLGY